MAKKRGSLSVIELHVEKGLLAPAVLFMVFLGVRFPDRRSHQGRR